MEIFCTRPHCLGPVNSFPDLDESDLKSGQQRYCSACNMPLILEGRYLPLKKLGGGGFGDTFLALDLRSPTRRQCAVKRLRPEDNLDLSQLEKLKEMFGREAEVLETLGGKHSQIPTLYDYFESKVSPSSRMQVSQPQSKKLSYLYLVQEYVDGQDLAEELKQKENGRFSEGEVLEILQQILPVLQIVHDNNAIHRDIKPENIMRDRNGRLYLLDFGAVKQVPEGVDPKQSSIFCGTPGFAPREQRSGERIYPSTDLYALAGTCLCLLGGFPPPSESAFKRDLWDRWRSRVPTSDRLDTVLDRMSLSNPKRRFQSAEEVLAAIAQISHRVRTKKLPTHELLGRAAFTGFEGGLLAIALASLLKTTLTNPGIWLLVLPGLIFIQYRSIDLSALPIIAIGTLVVVLFVPSLQTAIAEMAKDYGIPIIIMIPLLASLAGLFAFTFMALSRLIYNFLSSRFKSR
ncbi:MAG: serine/threonine protein kinase [Oscillatoria sp. SIO1A7]|nr:serine/threonine protein kinase [Oscillatoria sp. SIO1A7]